MAYTIHVLPASSPITLRYYTRITHIHRAFSYHNIFIPSVSYSSLFNLANMYSSFCTQLRYYPLYTFFPDSPKLSKVLPCYTPIILCEYPHMAPPIIPIHGSVFFIRLKALRGGQ